MRTQGFLHDFPDRDWTVMAKFLGALAEMHPTFAQVASVPVSVIEQEATHLLAGITSMHDILVVPRPIPDRPATAVRVRAPDSANVPPGCVVIEDWSVSGHNDRIVRPVAETLPLFWKFMIMKFGAAPPRRTQKI